MISAIPNWTDDPHWDNHPGYKDVAANPRIRSKKMSSMRCHCLMRSLLNRQLADQSARMVTLFDRLNIVTRSSCYSSAKPQNCPKWLGESAKGGLCMSTKSQLQRCKKELHWCKRLLGDHLSNWSKHLLHPRLTTLSIFEVSGSCSTLKTRTPQIWEVKIHPPNLGGESSRNTCFTVLSGAQNLGGKGS